MHLHLLEKRVGRAPHLGIGGVQALGLDLPAELADLGILVEIDFVQIDLAGLKVEQNPRLAGFSPAAQGVAKFLLGARSVAARGRAEAMGQNAQVDLVVGGRLGVDDRLRPRPDLRHNVIFPLAQFQPYAQGAPVRAIDAVDHLVQHAAFFGHVAGRGDEDADELNRGCAAILGRWSVHGLRF